MSPGAVAFPQSFPRGFELPVSVPVLLSRPRQAELQACSYVTVSVCSCRLLSVCLAHMSRVLCEPRLGDTAGKTQIPALGVLTLQSRDRGEISK